MRYRDGGTPTAEQLAMGLGLFSVGLGMAEVLAPRGLSQLIGLGGGRTDATLRAFGAREIGNGLALLADPRRAGWAWSRVGGDAIDLAYLLGQLGRDGTDRRRLAGALTGVAGVTALDILCAMKLNRNGRPAASSGRHKARAVKVERVVTINRPIEEVYRFWRTFENFPRFMRHLESVETSGPGRSHWRARGPAGTTVEWEAEMLQDRENEWIAWRSLPGSQIENSGSVRFQAAPGARGTEVRVQLQYSAPGGAFGRVVAKLFGEEPNQQIQEDLLRFKQLMETGEIPVSDGPSLRRPARPADDPAELRTLAGVRS